MGQSAGKMNKLIPLFAVCLLFLLEGIYLKNTFMDKQYNTGTIQMSLLIVAGLFVILNLKTKMVTLVMSGVFLCFMMFMRSILNVSYMSMSFLALMSKCFLWIIIFFLGYISTSVFDCENAIPKIATVATVIFIFFVASNKEGEIEIYSKETVVTSIYYVLCCVPFLFCLKQKKLRNTLFVTVAALLFLSFKRSALLVVGVAVFVLFFVNNRYNPKFKFYVIGVTFVIVLTVLIYNNLSGDNIFYSDTFELWQVRFSEGGGSRYDIWRDVFKLWINSSVFELFFGHGYNAVMKDYVVGLSAHNDFLEILYNYGLFSLILFIYFVVGLFRFCKPIGKANWAVYNGYVFALVIFVMASIPSHMLTYSTYFMMLSLYFGYAIGIEEKRHRQVVDINQNETIE